MEKKLQTQTITAYPLRGMDERWKTNPTAAARIRDMTWDPREGWRTAGGFGHIIPDDSEGNNAFDTLPAVNSLHWFSQKSGALQWLIWETETGLLHAFNGSLSPSGHSNPIWDESANKFDGSDRSRATQDTPWGGTQSAVYGDNLYLVNGVDEPLCFDGIKAMRAGFVGKPPPPNVSEANKDPAGILETSQVSDNVGLGFFGGKVAYRYRLSFINERGQESPLSEASVLVEFTNSGSADTRVAPALSLPQLPSYASGYRLYRTTDVYAGTEEPVTRAVGDLFYFHSEISGPADVFQDITPDASLGSLVDPEDYGEWPADADIVAVFKNTVFLGTENGVLFSRAGQPEIFPADNIFTMNLGRATAFLATRNALVVWTERSVSLIKGDPVNGFYKQDLFENVGTSAPRGAAYLPSLGVIFISETGIWLLKGALENTGTATELVPLHTQIPDLFERVNTSALVVAKMAVYPKDRELWVAVPSQDSWRNDIVMVYHYEIGAWSYRENYPIGGLIVTGDHRGYLIFGSNDATNTPGVFVYGRGFADKDGTANQPMYETVPMDFGSRYDSVGHTFYVYATVIGYGKNDCSLNVQVNRRGVNIYDSAVARDQRYAMDANNKDRSTPANDMMPLYDTVSWGDNAKWGKHRPVTIRWDVSSIGEPPVRELQLAFTWTGGERGQIIDWGISIGLGRRRSILPMTEVFGGDVP